MAKLQVDLHDAIRTRGLRVTPSRIAVLELVRASDAPMSHGDVADRLATLPPNADRATIYRNLIDLADVGLLRRTDVGDHVWRFEAVADDHDGAHPHFVCTECGSVACLPELELSFPKRDTSSRRVKAPRAVKQRQVEVHVRGLCDSCI